MIVNYNIDGKKDLEPDKGFFVNFTKFLPKNSANRLISRKDIHLMDVFCRSISLQIFKI